MVNNIHLQLQIKILAMQANQVMIYKYVECST
jgi:hypothetical protein